MLIPSPPVNGARGAWNGGWGQPVTVHLCWFLLVLIPCPAVCPLLHGLLSFRGKKESASVWALQTAVPSRHIHLHQCCSVGNGCTTVPSRGHGRISPFLRSGFSVLLRGSAVSCSTAVGSSCNQLCPARDSHSPSSQRELPLHRDACNPLPEPGRQHPVHN